MRKHNDYDNGFSNLYNYSHEDSMFISGSIGLAKYGWTGEGVDVCIVDHAIDPTHYEFTNTETQDSRVQLVDWNYLVKHIDRLVLSGSAGWDEWRARDYTFAQIDHYIKHLINSQNFSTVKSEVNYISDQLLIDISSNNPAPAGIDLVNSSEYLHPETGATLGFSSSMAHYIPLAGPSQGHGTHCAGTVAGRTVGWAHKANIYGIDRYEVNINGAKQEELIYYLQLLKKAAGYNNCIIVNNSYGFPRNQYGTLGYHAALETTKSCILQGDRGDGSTYTWEGDPVTENSSYINNLFREFTITSPDDAGIISASFEPFYIYTGSLAYTTTSTYNSTCSIYPDLDSQVQAQYNFIKRYGYSLDHRVSIGAYLTNNKQKMKSNNWGDGYYKYQYYLPEYRYHRTANMQFRQAGINEGAIYVYAAGNDHHVMNTVSASEADAVFIHSASLGNQQDDYFVGGSGSIALPTGSDTPAFDIDVLGTTGDPEKDGSMFPFGSPDTTRLQYATTYWLQPGVYSHTRSYDEYKDGVLYSSSVHTVPSMLRGDMPTALVYDQNVIAVGASTVTMQRDPHAFPDQRPLNDFDIYATGIRDFAENFSQSAGALFPDDRLVYPLPGNSTSVVSEFFKFKGFKNRQISTRTWKHYSKAEFVNIPGDGTIYNMQTSSAAINTTADSINLSYLGWLEYDPAPFITSYNINKRSFPTQARLPLDSPAEFSNTGPRVDIWAPGEDIVSARQYLFDGSVDLEHMFDMGFRDIPKTKYDVGGTTLSDLLSAEKLPAYVPRSLSGLLSMDTSTARGRSGKIISKYRASSGTSMAAPQVVGALALYAQVNPTMTVDEARYWLQTHAYHGYIPDITGCTPFSSEQTIHKSVYGDAKMQDMKRVFNVGFHYTERNTRIIDVDDVNGDRVEVEDIHSFRQGLLLRHELATYKALNGAPNLILHFPYYNTYASDFVLPTTSSVDSMLSNVTVSGSIGIGNIVRSTEETVIDIAAARTITNETVTPDIPVDPPENPGVD